LNEHYIGDGAVIFKHVCKLGCEGIDGQKHGQGSSELGWPERQPQCPFRVDAVEKGVEIFGES
jgi:hypothetical protein